MKAYIITNKGSEVIAAKEVKELGNARNIETRETVVIFNISKLKDLCRICYRAQSIYRAALLISQFKVEKNLKETIKNSVKNLDKDLLIKCLNETKFKIECKRIGQHDFNSIIIAKELTKEITKINKKARADYNNYERAFFLYIYNNTGYFGLDFSGFELAKRHYKIFNHPESLKATTAYFLARIASIKENSVIVDPFMGSGVIVIESALYLLKFPAHFYEKDKFLFNKYDFFKKDNLFEQEDKKISKFKTNIYGFDSQLRFLRATRKNAKLAGIENFINLSKLDVEWLDTKFDKHSVDFIITDPPRQSKRKNLTDLFKLYREFFYQADFILKEKGTIILLAKNYDLLEKAEKNNKFKITKKYAINQGEEIFNVLVFRKV